MTPEQQLEQWLVGVSLHNQDRDECCPDFSCCRPKLQADLEQRQKFYDLDKKRDSKGLDKMLMGFLRALLKSEGKGEKEFLVLKDEFWAG